MASRIGTFLQKKYIFGVPNVIVNTKELAASRVGLSYDTHDITLINPANLLQRAEVLHKGPRYFGVGTVVVL